jgi:hypothetical protein
MAQRIYRNRPVASDGERVPQAGMAAWRDASLFNKPGRGRCYHIVAPDGGAACSGAPLILDRACPPVSVVPALRCGRAACAKAWPHEVGIYRCAECGHGDNLIVWAGVLVHGPLMADGHIDLDNADYMEEDFLHEDSIQCGKHPDGPLEKSVDGQWCRWWNCPRCRGEGRYRKTWDVPDGFPCPDPGIFAADGDGRRRVHGGWLVIGTEVPSLNQFGHEYPEEGRPICRHCGCDGTSLLAERPCSKAAT